MNLFRFMNLIANGDSEKNLYKYYQHVIIEKGIYFIIK